MAKPAFSVLIPAAGASVRLGQAKQLLQYRGKPLLAHILDVASATGPLEIIVVTGANAELVRKSISHPLVRWVNNQKWAEGMGASIAQGAAAVNGEADGVLIMLCDQYRVEPGDLQTLVDAWRAAPGHIVASETAGRLMPPVIFPVSLLGALKNLAGDTGAHRLLQDHLGLLTTIAMDSAAFDVDTHEQLLQMRDNEG
jgi:molybdenum cofactor cytidylyltransferase